MSALVDIGKGLACMLYVLAVGAWVMWLMAGVGVATGTRWMWLWVASWVVTILFGAWLIGRAL